AGLEDGDVLRIGDSFFLVRYRPLDQPDAAIDSLVGDSPAIQAVRTGIDRIAPTGDTLLLLGESGAGKEVAARAVHERSGRPGTFVAVNCGAIPETLAESQLFGHLAGAF